MKNAKNILSRVYVKKRGLSHFLFRLWNSNLKTSIKIVSSRFAAKLKPDIFVRELFAEIAAIAVVFGVAGCMNLDLYSEMTVYDTETATDSSANTASDTQSGSSATVSGDSETGGDLAAVISTDTDAAADSAKETDSEPPVILPAACVDGQILKGGVCLLQRAMTSLVFFNTSESASVEINWPEGTKGIILSKSPATAHEVLVTGLKEGEKYQLQVALTDGANNKTETLIFVEGSSGYTVSITEIMADPNGAEPAQEFVEIANYGTADIDISGWMIDDNGDANGDLIPQGSILKAHEVALLVSESYNPLDTLDPSPVDGTHIIRLTSAIGTSGLKNSEAESVELYDAAGELVSFYNGSAGKPEPGNSVVKTIAELPDNAEESWVLQTAGTADPGIAYFIKSKK
jgi:hypothetical protein